MRPYYQDYYWTGRIGTFLWGIHTYRAAQATEAAHHARELSKPFRELEMTFCKNVTDAVGNSTVELMSFQKHKARDHLDALQRLYAPIVRITLLWYIGLRSFIWREHVARK